VPLGSGTEGRAGNEGIFKLECSKASVVLDCVAFKATITMKKD